MTLLVLAAMTGCASLSKSQVQAVNTLALKSDSLVQAPQLVFENLAEIRRDRGAMYAASLTSPEAHLQEVGALAKAYQTDVKLAARTDLYVNVLQSYLRALRSITAPTRHEQYGTRTRGIGLRMDSIITKYNALEFSEPLPEGFARSSTRIAGMLTENFVKNRQVRAVREFVLEGDTLVASCVDELVALLKKGGLKELIDNEAQGLDGNYLAYLRRMELAGEPVTYSVPEHYMELREQLYLTEQIRNNCITALQALKRAHHKLPSKLSSKGRKRGEWLEYWQTELIDLNYELNQLYSVIQ